MKGWTANPLIQRMLINGSEQKPTDKTANRLC